MEREKLIELEEDLITMKFDRENVKEEILYNKNKIAALKISIDTLEMKNNNLNNMLGEIDKELITLGITIDSEARLLNLCVRC